MRLFSRLAVGTSLALVPVVLAAQPAARPITAQEIVQPYIAARGGLDKLRAIRTLVFRGPPRPNGRPGRQILRARPFYLNVGSEGNDGAPWGSSSPARSGSVTAMRGGFASPTPMASSTSRSSTRRPGC